MIFSLYKKILISSLIILFIPFIASAAQQSFSDSITPVITEPSEHFYPDLHKNILTYADQRTGEWEIYYYNLETEKETRLTFDGSRRRPAVHNGKIVWGKNGDIYLHDTRRGETTNLTKDEASQLSPDIYNNTVVWRKVVGPRKFDVIKYNYKSGQKERLTSRNTRKGVPDIQGQKVVWEERSGIFDDYDIHLYDLSSDEETRITSNSIDQKSPSVHGNILTWTDFGNGSLSSDVHYRNLKTGKTVKITDSGSHSQRSSRVWGSRITYVNDGDIYVYDVKSGDKTNVTNHSNVQSQVTIYKDNLSWIDHRNPSRDIFMTTLNPSLSH